MKKIDPCALYLRQVGRRLRCPKAERRELLAGWLRAGQYRYFIKTLYSYLLWNSWLKKKQARKTYEVEI